MAAALALLVLALLGAPIFAVMASGALLGFWRSGIDLSVVAIEIQRLADLPMLSAIPLFTFSGYLLSESDAPARLVRLTDALLGQVRGGLALVALASSSLFTAFTGASGVTVVALGALLYPALRRAEYPEKFSLGLVTTSGCLGLLFAPALPLILFGVVVQQMGLEDPPSIQDLFLAGALPGVLMLVLLGGYGVWIDRSQARRRAPFSWVELRGALRDAAWEIPLPFGVLGGIYSGYFAASEAAAVTAVYVLIVEVGIHREIALARLAALTREAMVMVGTILIILATSLASTNYLIDAEVPTRLFDAIRSQIESPFTFLLALNVFLLLLGMMLDIFSALVLIVPIVLPVALSYGVDPVHLGIIFLANLQIGYITPPVGIDLFIASHRFQRPILELCAACVPFFLLLLTSVLIITYWPALSLTLVHRMH
jgi:C4-dicarboxylate transporter, DctM subunit